MSKILKIKAEDTYPIRRSILRKGMTLTHKFDGDHEPDTLHLGVYENGKLLCVGSFMKASKEGLNGSQYQLRGMATAGGYQGKGYGKLLLKKAEKMLKKQGIDVIWCNARLKAIDFYEKLGYKSVGDLFDIPQVGPHYVLFKKI